MIFSKPQINEYNNIPALCPFDFGAANSRANPHSQGDPCHLIDNLIQHVDDYQQTQLGYISPPDFANIGIQGLKIAALNVRSLLANGNKVTQFLETTGLDILALQEIWTTDGQIPNFDLTYVLRQKKRGGGVGFAIKNQTDYQDLGGKITPNLEYYQIKTKGYIVTSTYLPPSSSPKLGLDELTAVINTTKSARHIVLGDFNINLNLDSYMSSDKSPSEIFHNFNRTNSLFPLTVQPTRIACKGQTISATIIDNILTNEKKRNCNRHHCHPHC